MLGTFTPMGTVPVLHLGPVRQRRLTAMRWGWYDHKRDNPLKGFAHLHARAETIDSTPTWIDAFHETRGVVFAKTFNIGEDLPNGKTKQWVCNRADEKPVAIAVLFDIREVPVYGLIKTFVMVTTEACAFLSRRVTRKISPAVARCLRLANASVSVRLRRRRKIIGTMRQPMKKGTRQPQAPIVSGGKVTLIPTPSNATTITATCWLPDCQLT